MADSIWNNLSNNIQLKKIGTPEDVAKLVVYLSNESASFITGGDFLIDGGMTFCRRK